MYSGVPKDTSVVIIVREKNRAMPTAGTFHDWAEVHRVGSYENIAQLDIPVCDAVRMRLIPSSAPT